MRALSRMLVGLELLVLLCCALGCAEALCPEEPLPSFDWGVLEASAPDVSPVPWRVDTAPPPSGVAGPLELTSVFDVAADYQGSELAEVLNLLGKLADGSTEAGDVLVEAMLEQLTDQTALSVVELLRPLLEETIAAVLDQAAPRFAATLRQLAGDLSTVAHRFETTSILSVSQAQPLEQPVVVGHELQRMTWRLGGERLVYDFSKLGLPRPRSGSVELRVGRDGRITLAKHVVPLAFAAFVRVALNDVLVPRLVPEARNLGELLEAELDCAAIGQLGGELVGFASLWTTACSAGLHKLGAYLEARLGSLGHDGTTLTLGGTGRMRDSDGDQYFDRIEQGTWQGTFTLGTCTAALAGESNTFTARQVR